MLKVTRALLIPIVFGLVIARPAAAQFGLRGGMNLSKFVGGDAASESKTKLRMGASLSLFHMGPISIVPEVYYAQRGGRQSEAITDPTLAAYDFSMNYIEVPLLAKISLPGTGMLRPYLAGGPVYAWQLKCEVSLISVAGSANGEEQDCQDDTFKNTRTALKNADKGIMFGGGLDLNVLGLGTVTLDARLFRGLDRLTEDTDQPDLKSQSVSLMLGWSLGAGGGRGTPGMRR